MSDRGRRPFGVFAAFGSLFVATFLGFLRVESLAEQLRQETLARAYVLCVRQNAVTAAVLSDRRTAAARLAPLTGETPASFQERRRVSAESLSYAEKLFAPTECPPRPAGVPLPVAPPSRPADMAPATTSTTTAPGPPSTVRQGRTSATTQVTRSPPLLPVPAQPAAPARPPVPPPQNCTVRLLGVCL